jgi:hypothetical protein
MKTLVCLSLLFSSCIALAFDLTQVPNPSLTPQSVVRFQLQALRENASGEGIEATFRFASPSNKAITGPLERFSKLFDAEQYRPMLNHQDAEVKLLSNDGTIAEVMAALVDANGDYFWYQFRLSRQNKSPYNNCWMTDAVLRVPGPGRSA